MTLVGVLAIGGLVGLGASTAVAQGYGGYPGTYGGGYPGTYGGGYPGVYGGGYQGPVANYGGYPGGYGGGYPGGGYVGTSYHHRHHRHHRHCGHRYY